MPLSLPFPQQHKHTVIQHVDSYLDARDEYENVHIEYIIKYVDIDTILLILTAVVIADGNLISGKKENWKIMMMTWIRNTQHKKL